MRPISNIARDIKKTWVDKNGRSNVWFGAVPYLDAMFSLSNISDNYGADSGKSIVLYFLSNAAQFRGPQARLLKDELKAHCK
jgi:hypothetical protein